MLSCRIKELVDICKNCGYSVVFFVDIVRESTISVLDSTDGASIRNAVGFLVISVTADVKNEIVNFGVVCCVCSGAENRIVVGDGVKIVDAITIDCGFDVIDFDAVKVVTNFVVVLEVGTVDVVDVDVFDNAVGVAVVDVATGIVVVVVFGIVVVTDVDVATGIVVVVVVLGTVVVAVVNFVVGAVVEVLSQQNPSPVVPGIMQQLPMEFIRNLQIRMFVHSG